jgi:hypothetical protein
MKRTVVPNDDDYSTRCCVVATDRIFGPVLAVTTVKLVTNSKSLKRGALSHVIGLAKLFLSFVSHVIGQLNCF